MHGYREAERGDIVVFVADLGTALPSHSKDAAESSMAPRHRRQSPDHSHRRAVTAVGTQINDKGVLVAWHVLKGYLQWHE